MPKTIEIQVGEYPHPGGVLKVFRSERYLRITFVPKGDAGQFDWFWNHDGTLDGTGTLLAQHPPAEAKPVYEPSPEGVAAVQALVDAGWRRVGAPDGPRVEPALQP